MTGGLIQLIFSGKQDLYLSINPEITFFKKIYRRYVNFSIEMKEILSEQMPQYNNNLTFIVNNLGDALHHCYLEIELPKLSFSDTYITNQLYIEQKKLNINNITYNYNIWDNLYNNLKGFVNIEINLYRILKQYLDTENISITLLTDEVIKFNYLNKINRDLYINNIKNNIIELIDLSSYINNINNSNKLITNLLIYDNNFISRHTIINDIDNIYKNMIKYLNYYHYKKNYYYNELINKNNDNQIEFNYVDYLGHNFFEYFYLEICGQEITKYSNDILHINQLHKIKEDNINNYFNMIGHNTANNIFNNLPKGGNKILVPLLFWFCKDPGLVLPLISLQNNTISINVKINDLKKIISFQNFEKSFDNLININIDFDFELKIILNKKLIYNKYSINIEYKFINYICLYINNELLKLKFNSLSEDDINYLLKKYGTPYTELQIYKLLNPLVTNEQLILLNLDNIILNYLIDKNQWIYLMSNINTMDINIANIIGSYYYFIDYNIYYSLIKNPNIKLIGEFIYFDDIERTKFANSKLEYIIETVDEDIYDINNNQLMFNCELGCNKPCKELIWYIQPQIFKDGLSEYGQNINFLYDTFKYFNNEIIDNQLLSFNQLDLLVPNVNSNYYTYLLSYKYLNNILPKGLYYHSFCLYPEETQPSGLLNLKQIKSKQYNLIFNKLFLDEYYGSYLNNNNEITTSITSKYLNMNKKNLILKFIYKSYNILIIHNKVVKLLFN
jgi:hypothetical protein